MGAKLIIYKALNKINGKIYVGQTVRKLKIRMMRHASDRNSAAIYRAIKKYGLDAFDVSILEICSSKKEMDEREQYWIKELNCKVPFGYNLTSGGRGAIGVKRPDLVERNKAEDFRKRKSAAATGEGNHFFGKKHSGESLEKMRVPRLHVRGTYKRIDTSERNKRQIGSANPMSAAARRKREQSATTL